MSNCDKIFSKYSQFDNDVGQMSTCMCNQIHENKKGRGKENHFTFRSSSFYFERAILPRNLNLNKHCYNDMFIC